ncbi:biotin--[acetyl-CoA-carboxylase] ligase [bacterium]|nr:MAG: biotin--[acetyl-CoA-carboxylase] ligase [bacterium]
MENFQAQVESLASKIPVLSGIHFFSEIGSTNFEAVELGKKGAPHGTLVVADAQSVGRGRLGRRWDSPAGKGLYFSLLLRPDLEAAQAPLTTLAAGLGLAQAIRGLGVRDLILKWPNDLMVAKKKLGGILTEMYHSGSKVGFIIVGVGINVAQTAADFSPEVAPLATSLRQVGVTTDRAELLQRLIPAVLGEVNRLAREGAAGLIKRWERDSGMLGLEIAYESDGRRDEGRVLGLAADGKLRVAGRGGRVVELLAEDTRLL